MRTALIVSCLFLAGCANTKEMRTLADQTSKTVEAHRLQVDNFIASQNDLNTGVAAELNEIAHATSSAQAATARMVDGWRMSDSKKGLLQEHDVAVAMTPQAILNSLAVADVKPTALSPDNVDKSLDASDKAFVALAKPPTTSDQVAGIAAAGQSIATAIHTVNTQAAVAATAPPAAPADAKPAAKP